MEFHLVDSASSAVDMSACGIVDEINGGIDINSFPDGGIKKIATLN